MEIRALTRAEDGGNLLRQALRTLRYRWRNIAGSAYDAEAASTRPDLPEDDRERLRRQMRDCLEARGGDFGARPCGGARRGLPSPGCERA